MIPVDGPDPRRASGPAATPAVSTGRTRDRTGDQCCSNVRKYLPGRVHTTACAVLAWDKTKPCAKIAPALECLAGTNGSDHSGRYQRADAGNAHEASAVGFRLPDLLDLACDGLDPFIEVYPVFVEKRSGHASAAISRPVGSSKLRAGSCAGPSLRP
jgi:hypothetical protein